MAFSRKLAAMAGLAAAVGLMARDEQAFAPRLLVLGVPALDLASSTPPGNGMISGSLRGLVRRAYFPDEASRSSPYASPLLAPSLAGLPRTLVMTAERDTLRRDGDDFAPHPQTGSGDPANFANFGVVPAA